MVITMAKWCNGEVTFHILFETAEQLENVLKVMDENGCHGMYGDCSSKGMFTPGPYVWCSNTNMGIEP